VASLVPSLRKTLYSARSIAGQLGFRIHTVSVVIARTGGPRTGDGGRWERVTPITEAGGQPPKVRWLKDEEKALGSLPDGTVEIGPITPEFTGGGTEANVITGDNIEEGAVMLVRITGPQHPEGADYRVTARTLDRALRYMLRAVPVGTQA
jgi:hypothetical protein